MDSSDLLTFFFLFIHIFIFLGKGPNLSAYFQVVHDSNGEEISTLKMELRIITVISGNTLTFKYYLILCYLYFCSLGYHHRRHYTVSGDTTDDCWVSGIITHFWIFFPPAYLSREQRRNNKHNNLNLFPILPFLIQMPFKR